MRCSVQNCFNDTKRTTKSHGITFHLFPKEPNLRNSWMEALGISDWEPKDRSTVCSEHFRNDDFYETRCGLRKIKNGAIPVSAQDLANDLDAPAALRVCRICLATDSKMFNIRDQRLEQAFTEVSGMMMGEEDKLPQRLCWECGHRLLTAARFRSKVLRAHDLLTGLPHTSQYITIRDIRSINRRQNQLRSHLTYKHNDPNDYHIHINDDQIIVKSEIKESDDLEPKVAQEELVKDEENKTELFYQEFDNFNNDNNDFNDNNEEFNNDTSFNDECANDNEDSDDKVLSEVYVKKKRKVKKVKVKKKEKVVRKKEEEDNPMTTMDKYKNSDVKRRKTTDGLDESLFTITTLSYDEQIAEIQKRQESSNYKSAPYKCGVCYRGFLVRDRYDAHVVRHSEQSGAYECFICKSRLKSARALRKHLTAQHTEKFSCKGCPFVTRNRGVAREHEKWHAGTKYQCPHCPSEFDKLTTYMGHIRIKHVSDFVCELCGYTFVSKKGIDVHKKKKHRLADKTVELTGPHCAACEVRFVSEEAHARHLKLSARHSSDADPNRIRNDSQSINAEKNGRVVRKVERRPVIHARDGETDQPAGPVACEQCGIQLRDLRLYAQHFRRAHPDKNRTKYPAMKTPCMCEQCGRIFQSMALLKDHMWVHTGEKRFKCDRCDKSFTQKTNLVFHMRVHSATRPSYECPLCGKHFAFFNNRRRHMFIHTGLKPFKCETCGKCFTTAGEQRAHVEHVHLKKPWPKRQRHREADPAPWQKCLDPMED